MKLIGFVCVLALAGAVGGCGDGETNGTGGTGGTGATGGTGGAGGGTGGAGGSAVVTDACTNADDTAVYDGFSYVDSTGTTLTGVDAVSEVASDCVLGEGNVAPPGCGMWVGILIGANTPENRAGAAQCVETCMADTGIDLTDDCLGCYGESVSSGAGFCLSECASDPDAQGCIDCRCGMNDPGLNIFARFDECSGLPREMDECM
ncbi:MAG: hypothetical protein OEM15_12385 [Myxococcales bacterium]|nr:hypothetical protein [Myxococcales bacterium]MDH3484771.1 hypothetical protein [Myxococcales bacterium]